jgi:hypothetical protein
VSVPRWGERAIAVPQLAFFDLQCVTPDASIIQYGKRGVGKTTLFTCLAYYNRYKWDEMYAFTKSYFNGAYQAFLPAHRVFPGVNAEVLRLLLDRNKGPGRKRVCIVLDDIISSDARELRHSKELVELFSMGRHYGISIVVNTQYPKALPPTFRDNADYAVVFITFSRPTLDMLWKQYGLFMDYLTFRAMVEKYTQNNGAVVCCPQRNSTAVQDMFNYVRATPHGAFRIPKDPQPDDPKKPEN